MKPSAVIEAPAPDPSCPDCGGQHVTTGKHSPVMRKAGDRRHFACLDCWRTFAVTTLKPVEEPK